MKTKMRQQHNVIRNRNLCKIIFSGNVMDVTIQPSSLASTGKVFCPTSHDQLQLRLM